MVEYSDETLINTFVNLLRKTKIRNFSVNLGHGTQEVSFHSKKLVQQPHSIIGNSKKINIKEVKKLPKSQIKRILQILFSTDGGVSFSKSKDGKERLHRKITFTAKKNPENLKIVQKLLALFGIKSRIHSFDLEIKGKENLKKFKEKIGFIDGVKITEKVRNGKVLRKIDCWKSLLIVFGIHAGNKRTLATFAEYVPDP